LSPFPGIALSVLDAESGSLIHHSQLAIVNAQLSIVNGSYIEVWGASPLCPSSKPLPVFGQEAIGEPGLGANTGSGVIK